MAYKDLEKKRAFFATYHQKNREAFRLRSKAWHDKNKAYFKAHSLKKKYGLTIHEYQDILDAQGGGCAICAKSFRVTRMHVDHDHKTGIIRGILCGRCNMGLGQFGDSLDRLKDAVEYLTSNGSSGATSTTNRERSSALWTDLGSPTPLSMVRSRLMSANS